MGIQTDIRHYWSKVNYGDRSKNYYLLLQNGDLQHTTAFTGDVNQNYNAFNIDAVYTWEFAPGSFINLVWKNASLSGTDDIRYNYFKNFRNTLDESHNNNLSFKILYFLDYLKLKGHKKKSHDK